MTPGMGLGGSYSFLVGFPGISFWNFVNLLVSMVIIPTQPMYVVIQWLKKNPNIKCICYIHTQLFQVVVSHIFEMFTPIYFGK